LAPFIHSPINAIADYPLGGGKLGKAMTRWTQDGLKLRRQNEIENGKGKIGVGKMWKGAASTAN